MGLLFNFERKTNNEKNELVETKSTSIIIDLNAYLDYTNCPLWDELL